MSEENSLTRSLERISRMINSQSFASALNDATRASAQINKLATSHSLASALNNATRASAQINKLATSHSLASALNNATRASAQINKLATSHSLASALNNATRASAQINKLATSHSLASALNNATRASAQINRLIKDSLYEGLVEKIIDLSTYIELDLDKFEAYEENLLEEENNYKSVLYPKLSSDDSLNKLHDINNKIDKLIDGFNAVEKKIDSNKEYTTNGKDSIKQLFKSIVTLFISNLFIGILFGFFGIEASSLEDYIVETGKQFACTAINYLNEYSTNKQLKSSKKLVVYKSNRKDSERVGSISEGQQVEVIYKKRNWTKIVYIDDYSKEYKEGWVFTRYLVE